MSTLNGLAQTPPMGWNSYDCYGNAVTEDEVKANADALAARLLPHGYEYVVIDAGWYFPRAGCGDPAALSRGPCLDAWGRLQPAPDRFPSAAGDAGFRPLADYVHGKGLKFGLHVMRGVPRAAVERNLPVFGTAATAAAIADRASTCPWSEDMYGVDVSRPGGREYYDSLAGLYASWGVDYIKADDICEPYAAGEVEALSAALERCGRPIVLSLSPGSYSDDVAKADHVKAHAELWRISADIWDKWHDVKQQFDRCRAWQSHIGPGYWPDCDMLPLGRIGLRHTVNGPDRACRLTHNERRTLMSLWCVFRSPLMIGGDLTALDDSTFSLLTNEEVLAVNRDSRANRELFHRAEEIAWRAETGAGDARYLAVFNLADKRARPVEVDLDKLDLGACRMRDLWARANMGTCSGPFFPVVQPHGARLYRLLPLH